MAEICKKLFDECPICLEKDERLTILLCNHHICDDCVKRMDEEYKNKPKKCPVCREYIAGEREYISAQKRIDIDNLHISMLCGDGDGVKRHLVLERCFVIKLPAKVKKRIITFFLKKKITVTRIYFLIDNYNRIENSVRVELREIDLFTSIKDHILDCIRDNGKTEDWALSWIKLRESCGLGLWNIDFDMYRIYFDYAKLHIEYKLSQFGTDKII